MTKVRTSQIPEDSPIRKITRKKQFHNEERDEIECLLDDYEPSDEEKKTYFKTLITFSDLGYTINPSFIQSIEKKFRLRESTTNFDAEPTPEYGIVINQGVNSGMNSPKADVELWYKNEYYRDQRYHELMKVLDEAGIKVITI